jgi:aldehyde:ferredoxin oxidoreductase
MLSNDTLSRVLLIDLAKNKFHVEDRRDIFETYLGGAGAAIRLLGEYCPEGCDPLAPENPIIFAVGPLTGLFPLASKTVAMFKSPLTGDLGESHCGGRSAIAIRMAGYGAIVIRGASEIPLYLSISADNVQFRNAKTLWGMGSSFTVGRVVRENERDPGLRTIMRIGRAGEALVSYSCVTTETYRHFGRMGLGAVFGSKKLKAIAISGKRSLQVDNTRKYRKLYDEIHHTAVSSPIMKKYHDLGTAQNILPLNKIGALPTRNLKEAQFDGAEKISGEAFAAGFLGRRLACSHCPVACIHIAALREPCKDEPYFYKTSMISYDYEPIFSMGSLLGISEPEGFLRLMDEVETLGIDVMSAGVVLAWATEALEKGLISGKNTLGLQLRWGDCGPFKEAIRMIVSQPNEFYRALARGVEYASSKYGGEDFALAFGKNEMPGYHTGPAAHAGFLVGARHSHLDNGGYSLDQKILSEKTLTPDELAGALVKEESFRQILSSLVVCFFAREIYRPDIILSALGAAGFKLDAGQLEKLGRRIHSEKFRFKLREGFSFENLRIPRRIFETPAFVKEWNEAFLHDTIKSVKKAVQDFPLATPSA